jgi:hypothetical protein
MGRERLELSHPVLERTCDGDLWFQKWWNGVMADWNGAVAVIRSVAVDEQRASQPSQENQATAAVRRLVRRQ